MEPGGAFCDRRAAARIEEETRGGLTRRRANRGALPHRLRFLMPHPLEERTHEKPAPAAHPIHELIRRRWSPRAFAGRAVEKGQAARLFEAARWAASCANEQPWAFVVTGRGTEGWEKLAATLAKGNAWAKAAPLLVLGLARTTFAGLGTPNKFAMYDLGQAVGGLLAEATALGLSVHQMAGFDADQARAALGIPESHEIAAVLAIGYAADAETLPEALQERELAPRKRHAIESFVHEGEFGKAAEFPRAE